MGGPRRYDPAVAAIIRSEVVAGTAWRAVSSLAQQNHRL
jgi:hypothetical protein